MSASKWKPYPLYKSSNYSWIGKIPSHWEISKVKHLFYASKEISEGEGHQILSLTQKGIIRGVTGKRAIHLMTPEERKKVPELHQMWIDIGAKNREEALSRVMIGDAAVYDHGFEKLHGPLAVSRAFDDKTGAKLDDGLIDIVVAKKCGLMKTVALFDDLKAPKNGAHVEKDDVLYIQCKSLKIDTGDREGLVGVDGEVTLKTPVKLNCLRGAFCTFV